MITIKLLKENTDPSITTEEELYDFLLNELNNDDILVEMELIPEVEVVEEGEPQYCPDCKGTGEGNGGWRCESCNATGLARNYDEGIGEDR